MYKYFVHQISYNSWGMSPSAPIPNLKVKLARFNCASIVLQLFSIMLAPTPRYSQRLERHFHPIAIFGVESTGINWASNVINCADIISGFRKFWEIARQILWKMTWRRETKKVHVSWLPKPESKMCIYSYVLVCVCMYVCMRKNSFMFYLGCGFDLISLKLGKRLFL